MQHTKETYNYLSKYIIGAAIEVHKELGPGLLESVYEDCMVEELESRGLRVKNQVPLPVFYKGEKLDKEFVLDLLVEDEIIVELKSVEELKCESIEYHNEEIYQYESLILEVRFKK